MYIRKRMRRALFLLTLALYGFSAMDLHEWVRVPQVVVHLLEHHSDFGHHDSEDATDHHDGPNDHHPFGGDCHEIFCACSGAAFVPMHQHVEIPIGTTYVSLGTAPVDDLIEAYSGSKWNPPKRA